ncbi:MAG: nitroreductase family protein, partial [Syntrophales bacterium LBB04]|nr:nitroreductase family protein [Syntrophales bacterium LBB04]
LPEKTAHKYIGNACPGQKENFSTSGGGFGKDYFQDKILDQERKLRDSESPEGNHTRRKGKMEITELANLIKTRRSIRQWQDKPVPAEMLSQAIELATWAPNAGNQQNWRFYAVTNRNTIEAIADAVDAVANEVYSWPEAAKFAAPGGGPPKKPGFFRKAGALIVVATSQYQSPVDSILEVRGMSDPRANQIREWRNGACSKIQSVGSALAYLSLVLHQMGLGSTWMTGPLQAKGDIERILKVPSGMDAVAVMPVGYPAETPSGARKPLAEVWEIIR